MTEIIKELDPGHETRLSQLAHFCTQNMSPTLPSQKSTREWPSHFRRMSVQRTKRWHRPPGPTQRGKARFRSLWNFNTWYSIHVYISVHKQIYKSKKIPTLLTCWWLFIDPPVKSEMKQASVPECSQEAVSMKDIRGEGDAFCVHLSPWGRQIFLHYQWADTSLLINLLFNQGQTRCHFLSLGTVNIKANQGNKMTVLSRWRAIKHT